MPKKRKNVNGRPHNEMKQRAMTCRKPRRATQAIRQAESPVGICVEEGTKCINLCRACILWGGKKNCSVRTLRNERANRRTASPRKKGKRTTTKMPSSWVPAISPDARLGEAPAWTSTEKSCHGSGRDAGDALTAAEREKRTSGWEGTHHFKKRLNIGGEVLQIPLPLEPKGPLQGHFSKRDTLLGKVFKGRWGEKKEVSPY